MTAPEPIIQCPVCGSTALDSERQEKFARSERGKTVPYWQEFYRCRGCHEEFLSAAQSEASSQSHAAALRQAERLVTPEEIKAARNLLGMNQDEFEIALGVGRKTVVRWERGTVVPSRAANGLLWFAVHYPNVFRKYARANAPEAVRSAAEARLIATISAPPDGEGPPKVTRWSAPSPEEVTTDEVGSDIVGGVTV
jgi:putative zinc finger/helix-turn-helix YgiT family protein